MAGIGTLPVLRLPDGWETRAPLLEDVPGLVRLGNAHLAATRGSGRVDEEAVLAAAVGPGAWTRRQVVVADPDGLLRAWASVHDRAAGRTDLRLVLDPAATVGDLLAPDLLDWQQGQAVDLTGARGAAETLLDVLVEEHDRDLQRWLGDAGFARTRQWLNMTRPVSTDDASYAPRPGVTVRRVGVQELGDGTTLPVAADLQTVHLVLEQSFVDHFNSYRESFPEFAQRLREDPGHRWDHWWLALVDVDGESVPGGALVSSVLPPGDSGVAGSYIDYIGVHRRARGRGVAKSLLGTVLADAARRGRDRVGLEVDADSPTGAADLYRSLGWTTSYVTESWHKDLTVPG